MEESIEALEEEAGTTKAETIWRSKYNWERKSRDREPAVPLLTRVSKKAYRLDKDIQLTIIIIGIWGRGHLLFLQVALTRSFIQPSMRSPREGLLRCAWALMQKRMLTPCTFLNNRILFLLFTAVPYTTYRFGRSDNATIGGHPGPCSKRD